MEARILIVDDDPVSMAVIHGLLAKEGYELFRLEKGRPTLDLLSLDPAFDLVLMDVMLPDMDGISVCRSLKGNPRTEHIPIVLISGFRTDDRSITEGLDAGAEGYLVKPVEDTALRAWVKTTLRISALRRQLGGSVSDVVPGHEEVLKKFAKLSHAVNNPLQALYATVDILSLSLNNSEAAETLVGDILKHAESVSRLVAEASLQAKALLQQPKPAQES